MMRKILLIYYSVFFLLSFSLLKVEKLTPSSLTLNYILQKQNDNKKYLVLPQSKYKKLTILKVISSDGKIYNYKDLQKVPSPILLQYEGKIHYFNLFNFIPQKTIIINTKRINIKSLTFEIIFEKKIDLKKKKYSHLFDTFLKEKVLNYENLPYFVEKGSLSKKENNYISFFKNYKGYFRISQPEGFYKITLSRIYKKYPVLENFHPIIFNGNLKKISILKDNNVIYFYQEKYEDNYTNKSTYWLVFSDKKISNPLFKVKKSKINNAPETSSSFFMIKKEIYKPKNYLYEYSGPDTLPYGNKAKWYSLKCDKISNEFYFSIDYIAPYQPDKVKLEVNFFNPKKLSNINYDININDKKIATIKKIPAKLKFTKAFYVDKYLLSPNMKISFINNGKQNDILYIEKFFIYYYTNRRLKDHLVIDTSLTNKAPYIKLPYIQDFYPIVFFKQSREIYKFAYFFRERYNSAGTLLLTIYLPTVNRGEFFCYNPDSVPEAKLEYYNPNWSKINKESKVLILTSAEFLSSAKEYTQIHKDTTFSIYEMKDIYNIFSFGKKTPEAIKNFLKYKLFTAKKIIPEICFLFGDCTNDYKGNLKNNVKNFVPSFYCDKGRDGFTSDYYFSTVLGNDNYADIFIARLPFNNNKDFQTYIKKAKNYKKAEYSEWTRKITLIADDQEFDEHAEDSFKNIPKVFDFKKIYLKDYILEDNFYVPWEIAYKERIKVSPECTKDILDTIQEGTVFSEYFGHGAPNILAHERILFGGDSPNSDFLKLKPNNRPTFMITLTCSTGCIDFPEKPWNICISEDFLRTDGSGAIALYVPSGKGFPTQHENIARIIEYYLFEKNLRNFAKLILSTQLKYYSEYKNIDHLFMYLFLGDPLLYLKMPILKKSINVSPARFPNDSAITLKTGEKGELIVKNEEGKIIGKINDGKFKTDKKYSEYWFIRNKGNEIDFGFAKGENYKPAILKSNFISPLHQGENSYQIEVKNNNNFDWKNVYLKISIFSQSQKIKEIKRKLPLKKNQTDTIIEKFNLKSGLYKIVSSIIVNNREIYKKENYYGIPYEEDKKIIFLMDDNSEAVKSGIIKIRLRFFNSYKKKLARVKNLKVKILNLNLEKNRKIFAFNNIIPYTVNFRGIKLKNEKLGIKIYSENYKFVPEVIKIKVLDPPDLCFSGPLEIYPENPITGESLFFKIKIKNTGGIPAHNFYIKFYEKSKTTMKNIYVSPTSFITQLNPEEEKVLTYKYLPWKNEGEKTYIVKIDPDDKIEESNENNNEIEKEIYVRKNFEFKTIAARTIRPKSKQDILTRTVGLQAIFSNVGEADAYGVVVTFYCSTTQTDEYKIGEVYLDKVEAGKTYKVTYKWHHVPTGKIRWTYNVGLKVSTARVSFTGENKENTNE